MEKTVYFIVTNFDAMESLYSKVSTLKLYLHILKHTKIINSIEFNSIIIVHKVLSSLRSYIRSEFLSSLYLFISSKFKLI